MENSTLSVILLLISNLIAKEKGLAPEFLEWQQNAPKHFEKRLYIKKQYTNSITRRSLKILY